MSIRKRRERLGSVHVTMVPKESCLRWWDDTWVLNLYLISSPQSFASLLEYTLILHLEILVFFLIRKVTKVI